MTHIDDWLDEMHEKSGLSADEVHAKDWLEHFRRPAFKKDLKWLEDNPLFCTYKDGKRYRCIGCSRLGDVWLVEDFSKTHGYDLRIDVMDCKDWGRTA